MDTGILYLCATPIGNLEDITLRALRILKEVDLIAAEDTRHSRKLLSFYDIHQQLTSYHEHNKKVKGPIIIEHLLSGKNVALVTDAGTPAISDPGHDLVVLAIENKIPVISLPGAAAFVTALTISGLPTGEFVFVGFLPTDKKKRRIKLEEVAKEHRTIILYEAPHRIKTTLKDLYNILNDREIAVIRELTKKFEEVRRGTINDLMKHFDEVSPKGEFCLVIQGASDSQLNNSTGQQGQELPLENQVQQFIGKGLTKREAIKEVARLNRLPKRDVYNLVMKVDKDVD